MSIIETKPRKFVYFYFPNDKRSTKSNVSQFLGGGETPEEALLSQQRRRHVFLPRIPLPPFNT